MTAWVPVVGEWVAIVYRNGGVERAAVARVAKTFVEVQRGDGARVKYSLAKLRMVGGAWDAPRIERWTAAHAEHVRRLRAIRRLDDAARVITSGRTRLDDVDVESIEHAAACLRALIDAPKEVPQ